MIASLLLVSFHQIEIFFPKEVAVCLVNQNCGSVSHLFEVQYLKGSTLTGKESHQGFTEWSSTCGKTLRVCHSVHSYRADASCR